MSLVAGGDTTFEADAPLRSDGAVSTRALAASGVSLGEVDAPPRTDGVVSTCAPAAGPISAGKAETPLRTGCAPSTRALEAPAGSTPGGMRPLAAGRSPPIGGFSRGWRGRLVPSVPRSVARTVLRVRRRDVVGGRRRSPLSTPAGAVTCRRPGPFPGRARGCASPAVADASHTPSRPATPHAPIGRRRCRRQARDGARDHGAGRPRPRTRKTLLSDQEPQMLAIGPLPNGSARTLPGADVHRSPPERRRSRRPAGGGNRSRRKTARRRKNVRRRGTGASAPARPVQRPWGGSSAGAHGAPPAPRPFLRP